MKKSIKNYTFLFFYNLTNVCVYSIIPKNILIYKNNMSNWNTSLHWVTPYTKFEKEKLQDKNINQLDKNYSISSLVQKILEHSFVVVENSKYYEELKRKFYHLFSYFLRQNLKINDFNDDWSINRAFLNSYLKFEWDDLKHNFEKIFSKIEKNLIIFLPLLIQFVQKDLENEDISIDSKEWNKIIKDYIKKIFNIILIFWDKIDFNLIKKLLSTNVGRIEKVKNDFLNISDWLDQKEFEFNETINFNSWEKKFKDNYIFSSAFRISHRRAYERFVILQNTKNKIEDKEEQKEKLRIFLKEELENEIKISFVKLYELFLKTINLKTKIDKRLVNINKAFSKLICFIDYLRESNLAFQNIHINSGNVWFAAYLVLNIFDKSFDVKKPENDIFMVFLEKNIENDDKNNINFNIVRDKINEFKELRLQTNLEYVDKIHVENFDIKSSNIDDWEKIPMNDRYTIFIEEILKKNDTWRIKINSILKFWDWELPKLIKVFSELYWHKFDVVEEQIKFIKTKIKEWVSLTEFISEDVNNILFLYKWWRFVLLINKFDWVIHSVNFYKENIWKENWLNDIIIQELKSSKLFKEEFNVDLSQASRLHNLSSENTSLNIDWIFKSLAKWNIDLKTYKVWWIYFSEYVELYCPWEKSTSKETLDYIEVWINACIKVLQWRTTFTNEENEYINILKSKNINILPARLDKITEKDKNNISKLIEALKVSKSKFKILDDMLLIASKDWDTISEIFDELLKNDEKYKENINSSIWPKKEFWRAFVKLIKNYNWDFHKLWDLSRLRVERDSFWDLIKTFISFINIANKSWKIENILIEDWTGHLFSISEKDAWYRDLKVFFTLKSWNVVEFQFLFSDMLNSKTNFVELKESIIKKLKIEQSLLDINEVLELIECCNKELWKLPHLELINILSQENLNNIWINKIIIEKIKSYNNEGVESEKIEKLNCDMIYDLRRKLKSTSSLWKKLKRLERILFDEAWSKVLLRYLKNKELI